MERKVRVRVEKVYAVAAKEVGLRRFIPNCHIKKCQKVGRVNQVKVVDQVIDQVGLAEIAQMRCEPEPLRSVAKVSDRTPKEYTSK